MAEDPLSDNYQMLEELGSMAFFHHPNPKEVGADETGPQVEVSEQYTKQLRKLQARSWLSNMSVNTSRHQAALLKADVAASSD